MVTYPRSKADELQEARNHLEYFNRKIEALASAQAQIKADLAICQKEASSWAARIEKLKPDRIKPRGGA